MSEIKTTLKRIGVYYLILAVNMIFCANSVADIFPTRTLSALSLLIFSVCLVLYYSHRVTPTGRLSASMKTLSWMALLLMFLRGVKYSAVSEVGILARHAWYLYYLPILLIPLFLFAISLLVSSENNARMPKLWYIPLALTVALILLVLTNDLHRQVFVFHTNFDNWDNDYAYGWGFFVVLVWQILLTIVSVVVLVVKCGINSSKKNAWIILIPFVIGMTMCALLFTDTMPRINGSHVVEYPEAHVFMVVTVLECCMTLGLIPTNTDYGKTFRNLSISAQITDERGAPAYLSSSSLPLSAEQFAAESGSRIGDHVVLHKMAIPGGFGFWQDDMTTLDRLNEELQEAKERLQEQAELTRLQNELKEKQTKIRQKTRVYDAIASRTQKQSQAISLLAKEARASSDRGAREHCRRRITLLGAYIKRYSNLTLIAEESEVMASGELELALSEVLRYLNYCDKPGEFVGDTDCLLPSQAVIAVFEAFETLLEDNYANLHGVFVNLSERENAVALKIIVENDTAPFSEDTLTALSSVGVTSEITREDNVAYLSLILPKGGERV